MRVCTIGMDIAKQIFQVHGEDAAGEVVLQKRLRRGQVLEFFAQARGALDGQRGSHPWSSSCSSCSDQTRGLPRVSAARIRARAPGMVVE